MIDSLKQELADFNFKATEKSPAAKNRTKKTNQLQSELQKLNHYHQFLLYECRRKDNVIDCQQNYFTMKNSKVRPP